MSTTAILKPRLSEKTYALAGEKRVYVFDVALASNKITVKQAVEAQFDTKVDSVKILVQKGKAKRSVSKGGRRVSKGNDNNRKKAYVTLAEGQSLPFFAAVEEAEEKQEKVAAAADKKSAKEAEKATKKEKK